MIAERETPPQDQIPTLDEAELDEQDRIREEQELENFFASISSRRDERRLAFYISYVVDRSDYTMTVDQAVDYFKRGYGLEKLGSGYGIELAQGALEARERYDDLMRKLLKNWKLERLGCCTRLILRQALWEMEQKGSVASIIINEAVELAKQFAEKDAHRFVNGVLDEAAKHLGLHPQADTKEEA